MGLYSPKIHHIDICNLLYVMLYNCLTFVCIQYANKLFKQTCYKPTSDPYLDLNNNSNNNDISEKYDALVVNLSQIQLTIPQISLLRKGLKFCPTPGEPDISLYQTDLDKFHLRFRHYLHFFRPKRPVNADPDPNTTDVDITIIPDEIFSEHQPFKDQKF